MQEKRNILFYIFSKKQQRGEHEQKNIFLTHLDFR